MINITEFYPTPKKLISKMVSKINLNMIEVMLEPQAGKGDIADYIKEQTKHRNSPVEIDTIEINENLRHILKGKGFRVVHDDFLTFDTYMSYDAIIMNPPFSDGDRHLLKALDLQKRGGNIVCLLNAETIRNPYTNIRKELVQKLEDYNAEIEYIQNAFTDAERKTDVEVALITVNIPKPKRESTIIDQLRQEETYESKMPDSNAVADSDFLEAIVAKYSFEIRAGLNLIDEYYAMQPYIQESLKTEDSPALSLRVSNDNYATLEDGIRNAYIKKIRHKYWEALFRSDFFSNVFTSKLSYEYNDKIRELENYDFSFFNIYTIKIDLIKAMSKSIEETIVDLFDEFSYRHHFSEGSSNIHYYNGWKTNKAWKINHRVIIRLAGFDSWNDAFYPTRYRVMGKLSDMEKVFDYLDGGRSDHVDMDRILKKAEATGQTRKIQLKYFNVTFYKKGTCHIEFTNLELLKKFNIFGAQRKNWLPPAYGKAKYEDMSQEEQAVINEFEGKGEYQMTLLEKDYFICETSKLLALTG